MTDLDLILHQVRRHGGASRRTFLRHGLALASAPFVLGRGIADGAAVVRRAVRFDSDPFAALGVASGDPTPTGVVLWTKLAPQPLEVGGGLAPERIEVAFEVAEDEALTRVVQSGTTVATPQLGHAVHIEVEGLKPDRPYWYRFRAGDATSPVGRTRTAPNPASTPDRLRLAFASCQHFEQGLFTAYEHMLQDNPDLVVHLGDYIYEGSGRDNLVRKHVGKKLKTLDDYRVRHNQYRSDPHLRAMHGHCPWVVTWDDHEFENNYANAISEHTEVDPADFLEQRAAAYQAYYEMMPLRRTSLPRGPHLQLYRTQGWGRLAEFQVLDTRQYRTDQPNGDKRSDINEAAANPTNTLLGQAQYDWLQSALIDSPATWNVLAQQVMMGMVDLMPGDEHGYSMDQWPGYTAERIKLVQFLADQKIPNPVVLTGDIHSNWVNDLRVDDRQPDGPIIAAEFVGTSISSGGNGSAEVRNLDKLLAENPGLRFTNRQRGYVRCDVTPQAWRADYRVVEKVTEPGAPIVAKASFVVEAGHAGVKPA